MQMVSTKKHRYGGKAHAVGDVFVVKSNSDARVVKALGWGVPHNAPRVDPRMTQDDTVVELPTMPVDQPEPQSVQAAEEVGPAAPTEQEVEHKPRRHYRRRDMTAES